MSKKSTKKALLLSALAMFACVAMLIGSTFAWFTDSVTSAGNKIQAGTLDIELYMLEKNGDWNKISESNDPIFDYDLWEPGYTDVKVLKIENEGTLALQWVAQFQSEKALSALANVIDVYVLASDSAIAYPTDRADLTGYTKVGTVAEFVNTIESTTNGTLLAGKAAYLAIALKMQESAGNEYQGLSLGEFDIRIFATQYTYEKDSFDEMYDDLAIVSNAADLKAAIAAGKNVILNGDIAVDVDGTFATVADGAEVLLDLNGYDIVAAAADSSKTNHLFAVNGKMSVIGNGTIALIDESGAAFNAGVQTTPISVAGGELTLGEGVVVKGVSATGAMVYAVDVNTTLGESVLNVNGATLYSSYIGVRIFNNNKTEKGIVNYNSGIIYGAKKGYDLWAQNMSNPAENAVLNTEIAYTEADLSGKMYYFADDVAYAADAAALKDALAAGKDVVLLSDIAIAKNETITIAKGTTASIDLNGYEISSTADKSGNEELFLVKGNLTIKNGSVEYVSSNNQGWGAMIAIFDITDGGVLNLDGVTAYVGGSDMNFIAHLNNWGSATLNVKDCDFTASYVAIRAFNSGYDMNNIVVENTAFHGGRVFWVHNYTAEGKDDSTLNVSIYGNGNTTDNAQPVRYGFSNSLYFNMEGKQFVTATTMSEVMAAAKNGNVIIDAQGANLGDFYYDGVFGNGTVLKNAKFTYVYGASIDGVATFENCEFVSDHSYSANFSDGSYTGKAIFNNCLFDGWSSFGDAITSVEMNGCTFEWNNPYSMLRFYQNAVLTDCNFVAIDGIDTNKTGTVVEFVNCTGIDGKIYNNGSNVGKWIVDGEDISSTVTSW